MSIQSDLRELLQAQGLSQREFAKIAGVNYCALSRFLNSSGCSIAERIVPYIYGDKKSLVKPPTEQK